MFVFSKNYIVNEIFGSNLKIVQFCIKVFCRENWEVEIFETNFFPEKNTCARGSHPNRPRDRAKVTACHFFLWKSSYFKNQLTNSVEELQIEIVVRDILLLGHLMKVADNFTLSTNCSQLIKINWNGLANFCCFTQKNDCWMFKYM